MQATMEWLELECADAGGDNKDGCWGGQGGAVVRTCRWRDEGRLWERDGGCGEGGGRCKSEISL